MTQMVTVGQMPRAQARLQPGRIGARLPDRALTVRERNARACRPAGADRVGVPACDRVEWAVTRAAVAKAGLTAVPVGFRLTVPVARFISDARKGPGFVPDDQPPTAWDAAGRKRREHA